GALHSSRPARGPSARDASRADVAGACARLRARGAADRGGSARQSRRARPGRGVGGPRRLLPVSLRQLLAARRAAPRQRAEDGRRRPRGVRRMTSGYLLLEDGTVFRGRSVGAAGASFGEAVFTTGMTGYQETVTDPSYAEQLVCFTAPMVGNYGVA